MNIVLCNPGVSFDVLYAIAVSKGMNQPVMMQVTGKEDVWYVAMDAYDFSVGRCDNHVHFIEELMGEGIPTDADDEWGDYDIVTLQERWDTYYYVLSKGE